MSETSAQMLQRLGADGAAWAKEFRETALRLGYADMDEGWLIGWFCSAIENGIIYHPDVKRIKDDSVNAQEMLVALRNARETIRAWHGPSAWDIYDSASPEMKMINAAIAKAEGRS